MKISPLLDRCCSGTALRADLHTHTARCKHAEGDVIDYARIAAACGLTAIATTDHGPFFDDRWSNFRMLWREVDDHIQAIEVARLDSPINIIAGFEYEYVPDTTAQVLAFLHERMTVDLVLFGPHFVPRAGSYLNAYTDISGQRHAIDFLAYSSEAIDSDLFDIAAHPDLFTRFIDAMEPQCETALRAFIEVCIGKQVACELNVSEFTKNPRLPSYDKFWRMVAEASWPVVISTDAHAPSSVNAGRESAAAFAKHIGLTLLQSTSEFEVAAAPGWLTDD